MLFQKPSLRTRVSFEVGMEKLGGHAIFYDLSGSPMGKGETLPDTAKTASRYADIIMARLYEHSQMLELAASSRVPVINALDNFSHPCQILADLLTIIEKKKKLAGLKMAYLGDGNNNVTHSLIFGAALTGMEIFVASPAGAEYEPQRAVVDRAREIAGKKSRLVLTSDPAEAVKDADIVVTDSWMSYHIPPEQKAERMRIFAPYQVDFAKMKLAKKDALFLHCLPAKRGEEVTAEVIDGPQSVVFDEAENRLWTEMAVMVWLLKK
jgi:ornithine carbamoyltransferase